MTETKIKYSVEMWEQCGGTETIEIEAADDAEAAELAESELRDWVSDGEYGDEGASISARWTLNDADGDEIGSGSITVEIEPDHDAMIKAAGGDAYCDHDWTSEGEGGLDENPGVWSTGGTSMLYRSHCRSCGLKRREVHLGSQRNPGEHDTTRYEQPDSWCAECEREDCRCEKTPPYKLRSTESGYSVVREDDGAYAEFLDSGEAEEAMNSLMDGDTREDDYEWMDSD